MGPSLKFHSYGGHGSSSSSSKRGAEARAAMKAPTLAVVKALTASQITGRGLKSLRQLPDTVCSRFETSSMAPLCIDFEHGLVSNHVEFCQRALSHLKDLLCDWSQQQQQPRNNSDSANIKAHPHCKWESFVLCGGDILLLRALCYPFSREDGVEKSGSSKVLAVRRDCLTLLRKLCASVPFFAEGLAANGEFVVQLFALMYYPVTFDQAVGLAEEILAARDDILRVQDIPDFSNLVRSLSSRQLASFCRVLAMVTFEPEAGNPWVERDWSAEDACFQAGGVQFKPMSSQAEGEEREGTVVDQNHDAILLVPDILARLVQLLKFEKKNSFSRSEGPVSQSTAPTAMDVDARFLPDLALFLDRTSSSTPALLLSHHLEVLFVLCALCGGKKKEQVQNCLGELGLVGVLNDVFDRLDWMVTQPRVHLQGIHGYGCACNPKSALKIQYLRLIHNFCDRDSCNRANKQLLLQPSRSKDGRFLWRKNAGTRKKSEEGLLVKILRVLINEPADSLYRFWLASCVEAFLRGADNKDQEFVASTGLMEHLVNEILKGGFQCATLLQINFDLLGELIKFNKTLFRELNRLLAGDKFGQFVEVLVTNLVDSNVFVRSVVLSVDHFKRSQHTVSTITSSTFVCSSDWQAATSSDKYKLGCQANGEDDFCMITAFISHNTYRLLRDLMCAVRVSDVNQDNICVLNTALIFFMFADKNGELQAYLQTLRASDVRVPQSFRALLEFWRHYYLWERGRKRVSLQFSTQLPFSDWSRIVDRLCAHAHSPCSLLHTGSPVGVAQCAALCTSSEPPPRRR